jgi:Concanavalin A-like lectin/glucanases superfamily
MRVAEFHHQKLEVQPMRCGWWILVCILLFISGRALSQTCVQPPSGLISWWAADGDATDLNGLNNGILEGNASFTSGEVGGAFSFANGTGYVSVPDSPSLNLAGDFTIELWANFTSLTGSRALIAKDNGPGQNNKWIFWVVTSPQQSLAQLQFLIGAGSSSISLGNVGFSPPLNSWHHVAVTRAGSMFSFYLDGALIGTDSTSMPIPAITAPLTIGEAEGGNFMGGLEDEVTVYGRASSASEIQAIYNAAAVGKCRGTLPPIITVQPQS